MAANDVIAPTPHADLWYIHGILQHGGGAEVGRDPYSALAAFNDDTNIYPIEPVRKGIGVTIGLDPNCPEPGFHFCLSHIVMSNFIVQETRSGTSTCTGPSTVYETDCQFVIVIPPIKRALPLLPRLGPSG